MRLKILAIVIMLVMVSSIFVASADIKDYNDVEDADDNNLETKEIRVAILFEQPVGSLIGTAKGTFLEILYNPWVVGNRSYRFITTPIYDKDILNGELNTDNYDVLIGPGGDVGDGEAIAKGFYRLPKVKKWKEKIAQFVKDGGGYCGYCGGTAMFTGLSKTPTTFLERQYDKSAIGVSCVNSYYKDIAFPMFYPFQRWYPEKVGAALYFFAFPTMDTQINTNHPIFDDYLEDTRWIKWIGGPALVLPDNPDREVHVLARYPEDLSENESTRVHVWRYTGGFLGLIRSFFKLVSRYGEYKSMYTSMGLQLTFLEFLRYSFIMSYRLATDWEKTDKVLDLNFSDKPCITAEVYPNENQGRIVLNGPHPEYAVDWGDYIEEAADTRDNCLAGLYSWVNATPFDVTYNWWIVRRQVAWAAKVPDDDLPPVYGYSQVNDLTQYEQLSCFTLVGNMELSLPYYIRYVLYYISSYNVSFSLDLYYCYSEDNASWGNWVFYETDIDASDGWSWEFNAPNETGYYQFYSIKRIELRCGEEVFNVIEKVPPGPDAIAYVI